MKLIYKQLIKELCKNKIFLAIFLCRFIKANRKQLGTMKALGFHDRELSRFFVLFVAVITFVGGILGLPIGYLASDVLVNANRRSYLVPQIVKGIRIPTILAAIFVPMACLC